MTVNVRIADLIVEVTRRCNSECEHCLRGSAQDLDMDLSYVDGLMCKIHEIGMLTITGGEPSLVPELISGVVELAKSHCVRIDNFVIETNGRRVTAKFLKAVMDCYKYCEENEFSSLDLGISRYSNDITTKNDKLLKMFAFYNRKFESVLIREGKSKDGNRMAIRQNYSVENFDGIRNVISPLYLNCKGNLVLGGDFSYESQDLRENILCNFNKLGRFLNENQGIV